jgi:hypothetical protein
MEQRGDGWFYRSTSGLHPPVTLPFQSRVQSGPCIRGPHPTVLHLPLSPPPETSLTKPPNPPQPPPPPEPQNNNLQTRDVAVYRLLTVGSVEIEMMEAQISKKKLERLSITGGDFRKAGRRSRGEMTTESLRELLKDDVHNIQRMQAGGVDEGDMAEEELALVMDRRRMFLGEGEEGAMAEEGHMYDVVRARGGDILSGMAAAAASSASS